MYVRFAHMPLLWVGAWLVSCVSGGTELQVVERSKEQPPRWVEQAPESLVRSKTDFNYVSVTTHSRSLPIAIKETQTHAIDGSERAMLGEIKLQVSEVAAQIAIDEPNEKQLDDLIGKTVRRIHGEHAQVND